MNVKSIARAFILILIGIIMCVGGGFIIGYSLKNNNSSLSTKIDTTKAKPIQTEELKLEIDTSNIKVEIIAPIISEANMPSYCKPDQYTVVKFPNGQYGVKLPGGTLLDESYKTANEANNAVLKIAAQSKKDWIESGGLRF